MRILMAHNRYLQRGGEDLSTESEIELLRQNDISVDFFEKDNLTIAKSGQLRTALATIWSQTVYTQVRKLIRERRHDVVHVQNFFPLISPAIYYAAKAEGAAVVQTVRNFRLTCPGGLFLREERVCEKCLGKTFPWPGIQHACYRNSYGGSGAIASMIAIHHLLGTWQKKIDQYITLTEFGRDKLVEAGFPASKMIVKPNFLVSDPGLRKAERKHFLFVGRLSSEKGMGILIKAWRQGQISAPLLIVGKGPQEALWREQAADLPMIKFLGTKPISEVYDLMGEAMALCFPSLWYETFGRTLIEAFAVGTPVISSHIGAMTNVVDEGKTGLFATPGNVDEWINAIKQMSNSEDKRKQMGQQARAEYEKKYTPQSNFDQLMAIYQQAIKNNKRKNA